MSMRRRAKHVNKVRIFCDEGDTSGKGPRRRTSLRVLKAARASAKKQSQSSVTADQTFRSYALHSARRAKPPTLGLAEIPGQCRDDAVEAEYGGGAYYLGWMPVDIKSAMATAASLSFDAVGEGQGRHLIVSQSVDLLRTRSEAMRTKPGPGLTVLVAEGDILVSIENIPAQRLSAKDVESLILRGIDARGASEPRTVRLEFLRKGYRRWL